MSSDEDVPFSDNLLRLYSEFVDTKSRERREELSLEIAALFAAERDATDISGSEEYHEFFEAYEQAQLDFKIKSLKLARVAVQLITTYLDQHETTVDTICSSTQSN